MGSSFIITESMLEKNGKNLMFDFYNLIHEDNEYSDDDDEILKTLKDYYDKNVVEEYSRVFPKKKFFKGIRNDCIITCYNYDEDSSDYGDELTKDEIKNKIKDDIMRKKIDIKFVFEFLSMMDKKVTYDKTILFEIDEDLKCLKDAFLKAYDLFYHCGHELK